MILPPDTTIAREKLTGYLFVPQEHGDKSGYLAQAGYTLQNADQLLHDLRVQILPQEAVALEFNRFGQFYEVSGTLAGPNGVSLGVRTIWRTEHLSGSTKFVAPMPDRRKTR